MAYKYATGSVRRGDIYNEDDAQGNTYIDWSEDAFGLVAGGTTNFVVSSSAVGIGPCSGAVPSSNFALDIPVSASSVRMGRLEMGAWPYSTGYGFVGHSYQDAHGSNKHLKYNILLTANGSISLNSLANEDMYFRIGTVIKAAIDSNGFFGIGPNAAHGDYWTPSAQLQISSSDDEMVFLCHDANQNPVLAVTGSGRVGIGTDSPDYTLDVAGNAGFDEYIYHNGDADTYIRLEEDEINIKAGNVNFINITEATQDKITFNDGGADVDFIVQSPSGSKAIYLNAGNEVLHINHGDLSFKTKIHSTNGEAITVNDNGVILNEDSAAGNDFRIETDNNTHMLFVDAGSNEVGIGTSSPGSTFEISGSQAVNYAQTAASITFTETHFIVDYTGNGDATFTLPTPSGVTGRMYYVVSHNQSSVTALTVTSSGDATTFQGANVEAGSQPNVDIDGDTPQSLHLISTGADWFILHDGRAEGH